MGYPYHELIAPAILLDNPGLTKNEFTKRLNDTSWGHTNLPPHCWSADYKHESYLYRLPSDLKLFFSQAYKDFQTPTTDSFGRIIYPPCLEVDYQGVSVIIGTREVDPETHHIDKFIREYKPTYTVTKHVVDESKYEPGVQESNQIFESETFYSENELFQKWPQFKPENIYDFSQQIGSFSSDSGGKNFIWKIVNDRYYLENETFNHLPAAGIRNTCIYGYTDLILTAEAIKNKAWKLLSIRGPEHYLEEFLEDFSESRAKYEKAIWDSHASIFAKNKIMNHFELIRFRLCHNCVDDIYESK